MAKIVTRPQISVANFLTSSQCNNESFFDDNDLSNQHADSQDQIQLLGSEDDPKNSSPIDDDKEKRQQMIFETDQYQNQECYEVE